MPGLVFGVAELLEVAAVALGLAGVADLAAVMDELVGEGDPAILRKNLHQLLLNFFCCLRIGEAEAAGDAEDVRVNDYSLSFAEADTENDVGGLAGCAGNSDEFGESLRDLAVEVADDFVGCSLDGFGFVAEEAGGADEVFKLGQCCFGHRLRSREAAEEFGRDDVDADVGALSGEDGGDEKFPGRAMGEGAFDFGVGFVESFEDGGDAVGGDVAALRFLQGFLRR